MRSVCDEVTKKSPIPAEGAPDPRRRGLEARIRVTMRCGPDAERFTHSGPVVRIGRAESNEIRLDYRFVSRSHARIEWREDRLWLRDEGSRQGTWVDHGRVRIASDTWIDLATVEHEFRIGILSLRVEPLEPDAEERAMQTRLAEFRRVLDALDPDDIMRAAPSTCFPALRHRALWREFVRRYQSLAEEPDGRAHNVGSRVE